jgi:hypothetical protein
LAGREPTAFDRFVVRLAAERNAIGRLGGDAAIGSLS